MLSPHIALFADKDSPQILEISKAIEELGGVPRVFDIQLGGAGCPQMAITSETLSWDGVDFSEINAAHIRCTSLNTYPALPPMMNQAMYAELRAKFLREQEYQSAVYSFFEEFSARGGLLVNSLIGGYLDHDTKTQFYEKLRSQGFSVPACLTTNISEKAQTFINTHEDVVFKPMVGTGSTRPVTAETIDDLHNLQLCPVLFQERVSGDTLRVHLVGDKVVLALKILADGVDSRTETKGFTFFKMPSEQEALLVEAHRFLGLHYSAWDIVATKEGRYVYLDCNSGPYVMWIGPEFRKFVFEQLAAYLVTYAKTGSIIKSSASVSGFVK